MMGLPSPLQSQAGAYIAQGEVTYGALDQASQGELAPMLGLAGGLARGIDPGSPAGSAIAGALKGATTGATIGTVIPGIGTVVGALVGAVFGAIAGILGMGPTDDRPAFVQKAEAIPTPGSTSNPFNCDVKLACPPVTGEQLPGFDLSMWWRAHLHGERFSNPLDLLRQTANNVAASLLSADGGHGSMLVDFGGQSEMRAAMARWNRWVTGPNPDPRAGTSIPDHPVNLPGASPVYFPDDTDSYGWFLNGSFWLMAAQGRSDLEALQWCLMQQWVMRTMGGPDKEAHLMWLVGRLHALLGPAAAQVTPPIPSKMTAIFHGATLHLVKVTPSRSAPSGAGAGVLAAGALALLFFL